MKLVTLDGKSGEFLVGDLDPLRVGIFVDPRLDTQSLASGCAADQVNDNLSAD